MDNYWIASEYYKAIKMFESISGWRDSDKLVVQCRKKIEELRIEEKADGARKGPGEDT